MRVASSGRRGRGLEVCCQGLNRANHEGTFQKDLDPQWIMAIGSSSPI